MFPPWNSEQDSQVLALMHATPPTAYFFQRNRNPRDGFEKHTSCQRNYTEGTPASVMIAVDKLPSNGAAAMKKSLESYHRQFTVCLASVTVFLSVLIFLVAFVAASRSAEASTDATVHGSTGATPPYMQRVTVTSKPAGATIYIDGIQVGRTPMTFPMPTGRYTLILLAPGHQQYGKRILVPDASLHIEATLVPNE